MGDVRSVIPKSVWFATLEDVAPSAMATSFPSTPISLPVITPVPSITKSNIPSSLSSLLMVTMATALPVLPGVNLTWNVVLPPAAMVPLGCVMTLKNPLPVTDT